MNDSIYEKRDVLRRDKDKLRKALSADQVRENSELICRRLKGLNPLLGAKTIMAFSSIRNEVNLRQYCIEAQMSGKRIVLPRVNGDDIEAVEYLSQDQMQQGKYGIMEPLGPEVAPEEIDAVLVPGLVFDALGFRLGYGAGYYDRYLPRLKSSAFKCGVCYELQVVDNVFPHPEDIPVHWIITEKSELAINWEFF